MPRWSVDLILIRVKQLGTARTRHVGRITAPTEQLAISGAVEKFNIPKARQNRIVVTKIGERDDEPKRF
jgi:hypothetical protein